MMPTARKNNRGFTLVETLVAVSILTISIIGTFTAVQNGLQSSSFSKDQVTAFYLAQEAMEYIRNVRDQNALAGDGWLTGITAVASDPCYFGKTCTIDSPRAQLTDCGGGWGSCPNLRQDPSTGLFAYDNSWTETNFKREVQFESISSYEVAMTVSMSWTSSGFAKTMRVRELLFDQH